MSALSPIISVKSQLFYYLSLIELVLSLQHCCHSYSQSSDSLTHFSPSRYLSSQDKVQIEAQNEQCCWMRATVLSAVCILLFFIVFVACTPFVFMIRLISYLSFLPLHNNSLLTCLGQVQMANKPLISYLLDFAWLAFLMLNVGSPYSKSRAGEVWRDAAPRAPWTGSTAPHGGWRHWRR